MNVLQLSLLEVQPSVLAKAKLSSKQRTAIEKQMATCLFDNGLSIAYNLSKSSLEARYIKKYGEKSLKNLIATAI